jgi:sugar (pentulose or hexulose) kinase
MDFADIAARVRVTRTFDPDPAVRAVYERMYGEYRRLYYRLRGMYAKLNA